MEGFYVFFQEEPTRRHMSLVVSPLKFLIRDQITELRKHNIMAYGILEGMEKEEIDVLFTFYLFLFLFYLLVYFRPHQIIL
jgi:superfamily II DNA helicase RecQ